MISTANIAWLAGILEGEGSFGTYRGSPTIQVQMTDADVVERIRVLLGVKSLAPWMRKDGYKPVYACRAHGAIAVAWMMTLYSHMGERRQAKIREAIHHWRVSTRLPRAPKGQRFPARCHPDRKRCGRGLCKPCYMREYRRTGFREVA